MSGMAGVLAGHFMVGLAYTEDQATSFDICKCGERANDIEQHQAAMLTAAGFGPVKEAGAAALEEAADWLAVPKGFPVTAQTNACREIGNRLRNRAATVRADSA